jgi:uncharacterized protein
MEVVAQHEPSFHRFATHMGEQVAFLTYKEEGGTIYFVHTEVPPEMEGQGIGGKLAKAGLDYARQHQLKVVARCPFVASYLKRHPEYEDLLESE